MSIFSPPIIGIDASRANTANRTGTEWYAFYVIQELKKIIPVENHVVLYSRETLRDGLEILPPNWESNVLRWPPRRLWTQCRLSFEMWRRPPDLLFVPVHALPVFLPKKSIMTIHDVAFRSMRHAYGFFENIYQRFVVWFAARYATTLLTVSKFSESEIIRFYPYAAKKIVVTREGCVLPISSPSAQEQKLRLQKYHLHQRYFLSVGRIESKKNVIGLLRAFALFQEKLSVMHGVLLVLVGKPGYGYKKTMQSLHALGLEKSVLMLGYVSQEDMPALYAGAEAFVFPSWYEGFGLPILEAFASRVPVIASHVASIPEVAGDAALYADPTLPRTFADAMEQIMLDPNLRKTMVEKGVLQLAKFSWAHTASDTWQAMDAVLRADALS